MFACRGQNDVAEGKSTELAILVEQPRNELIDWRACLFRLEGGRTACRTILGKSLGRAANRQSAKKEKPRPCQAFVNEKAVRGIEQE